MQTPPLRVNTHTKCPYCARTADPGGKSCSKCSWHKIKNPWWNPLVLGTVILTLATGYAVWEFSMTNVYHFSSDGRSFALMVLLVMPTVIIGELTTTLILANFVASLGRIDPSKLPDATIDSPSYNKPPHTKNFLLYRRIAKIFIIMSFVCAVIAQFALPVPMPITAMILMLASATFTFSLLPLKINPNH